MQTLLLISATISFKAPTAAAFSLQTYFSLLIPYNLYYIFVTRKDYFIIYIYTKLQFKILD